jgi:hypothetical protein
MLMDGDGCATWRAWMLKSHARHVGKGDNGWKGLGGFCFSAVLGDLNRNGECSVIGCRVDTMTSGAARAKGHATVKEFSRDAISWGCSWVKASGVLNLTPSQSLRKTINHSRE